MDIITFMKLLGYKVDTGGVCYGIANTFAMENEEGNLSADNELLGIINKIEITEVQVEEIKAEVLKEHLAHIEKINPETKNRLQYQPIEPLSIAPLIKKILEN